MKFSPNLLIFVSVALVLVFHLALTDAAALYNEESMLVNSDNHESSRVRKDLASVPARRQPFKYGVLGKRYAYGYLGKRGESDSDFEQWLDNMRERRAGRPQYGMLG